MSYDVHFEVGGDRVVLDKPHYLRGGTYAMDGTTEAWLNITWNYGDHFRELFGDDGIRSLYGKTAPEIMSLIPSALGRLEQSSIADRGCTCHVAPRSMECYWAATKKNVADALKDLLVLAILCPSNAVLTGD